MTQGRKIVLRMVAPANAPESFREIGDVELVGRLYVLRVPAHSSVHERDTGLVRLRDAVSATHPGEQFTAVVLPDGWQIEAWETT